MRTILIASIALAWVHAAQAALSSPPAAVDRKLADVLAHGDKKSALTLLDPEFSWVDQFGREWNKDEAVTRLAQAEYDGVGTDLSVKDYGTVAVVAGNSPEAAPPGPHRFLRVFVKRPGGWKAFAFQDNHLFTAAPSAPSPSAPAAASSPLPDCDNPCKTVPYTPRSADERAIVEGYMALETASRDKNIDEYARHLSDELAIYTPGYSGAPNTKAGAVAVHVRAREAGSKANPAPVLNMRLSVFGNAAIMISEHSAAAGPYRILRLWVKQDGVWLLTTSAQTRIAKSDLPER